MSASADLAAALVLLAEGRHHVLCHRSDLWISDDHEDRESVIASCAPCPLLDLCRAVVLEEKPTFGVWAGVDLTKSTRTTKPRTARA